eukprot:5872155-Alexandrium_andersonii.AAC.1
MPPGFSRNCPKALEGILSRTKQFATDRSCLKPFRAVPGSRATASSHCRRWLSDVWGCPGDGN